MTTKLTTTQKRANTLSAIRENFDLYPADWHRAVCDAKRLAGFIDDCVDAYVESEPEYYAGLPAAMHLAIAREAVERFAPVTA